MKLLATYNVPSYDNGKYLGGDVNNYIDTAKSIVDSCMSGLAINERRSLKFVIKDGSFPYTKNIEVWTEFL